MPSVAKSPDERWVTDLCRVWTGRYGWASLAVVIDCYTREVLGWHLSRSAKSSTTESALEQALMNRYGTLGRVTVPFLLRSDNGLVERVIRTIKEPCVHRQRFETLQHASRVLGDWIGFCSQKRPHQALKMKTPNQAFEMFRLAT